MPLYEVTAPDGSVFDIEAPDGISEEVLQDIALNEYMARSGGSYPYPKDFAEESVAPSGRGVIGVATDAAVGVGSGVLRAGAGLAGIGSMVPGINQPFDWTARNLNSAADYVDESLLSDFQLQRNQQMAAEMEAALAQIEALPNVSEGGQ